MRVLFFFYCLTVMIPCLPVYAEEVTAEILTIDDVTPMLQEFVSQKPDQSLIKVYGISQLDEGKQAKVFFEYMRAGRGGAKPDNGELNCFKLNSGKWYCGGVYDILRK